MSFFSRIRGFAATAHGANLVVAGYQVLGASRPSPWVLLGQLVLSALLPAPVAAAPLAGPADSGR
mgnify:CR=1 FL=1